MASERPNSAYPECVTRLIEEFGKLPGVGRRSAERLAFFVLKSPEPEAMRLAQAITDVKRKIRHCSTCWNLTDADPCPICRSEARDASTVLVEISPKLLALCDFSVRFERGDIARLELHLEGLESTARLAPAEAGTSLISTLLGWSRESQQESGDSVTVR